MFSRAISQPKGQRPMPPSVGAGSTPLDAVLAIRDELAKNEDAREGLQEEQNEFYRQYDERSRALYEASEQLKEALEAAMALLGPEELERLAMEIGAEAITANGEAVEAGATA